MSFWTMEIFWTFDNKQKINLYVKLHDQYVQPDQSGFINQVRVILRLSTFRVRITVNVLKQDHPLLQELLTPLEWHSLCLTFDHKTTERSVFIDTQLILQDKIRN